MIKMAAVYLCACAFSFASCEHGANPADTTVKARIKHIEIPVWNNGDTEMFYKWYRQYQIKIGLPNLIKSNEALHFRFWRENQVVDIWTTDKKTFHGIYADFTTNGNHYPDMQPGSIFCDTIMLNTEKARQVNDAFTGFSIFSIPAQNNIEGWLDGNDGEEFAIECSTPSAYYFRLYWTPSVYKDKIKEADEIDNLDKLLCRSLDMETCFRAFLEKLPKGCYRVGEMGIYNKK